MSRQRFRHYLLLFFSVNAILICGSSRRIPRRASCPSCSQDNPELLTVQVPWYGESYRESYQPQVQDFSFNPLKSSMYPRLTQEQVFQDMIHDDILSNPNSLSFGNYRSYPQQEFANEDLLFRNHPNKFSEVSDRREIFSQSEPISEYSFAHVSPPRQSCDRLENLFFRSPRDKYSVSSPKNQNFQDYRKNKVDLASTYRVDRDTKPWEDTRSIFANNILAQGLSSKIENSFPFHQENALEERKSLIKTPNSVDRRYKFANPQEAYYPDEFGVPEIKHGLHSLPQDLNTEKATEDERFFNNLDENSLPSWTLGRLKQAEDFLEVYPARDKQTIITEADNKQINHNAHSGLIFPQDLNIWKPTKYGKPIDNWDLATRNNPHRSEEIKQFQKAENNWQFYPRDKFDILFADDYSDEEDINQEYFKDEVDKDTIKIERGSYNPYNFSQNIDIWGATQDKELSDSLNFMSENLHENEKGKQEIYSQDNKLFQDKENEDVVFKHRTNANTDQMTRTPVNLYNSFLSRYFNIFNNAKHSAQPSEESQESTKYNTLHKNPVEERNSRFLDKAVTHNAQDLLKDISDPRDYNEYDIPAVNTWQSVKDNIQNKASRELDPDLFDDIESPPTKPTEPTATESYAEFSTHQ